jgi:integrase
MLATGARIGELMGAVWADHGADDRTLASIADSANVKFGVVDLEKGTWLLPTTKNEREHLIHLSAFAISKFRLLAAYREVGGDGKPQQWIFPNSRGTGPIDVKSLGKQLADRQRPADRRIAGRSKSSESLILPGGRWTAHDLRRTAGTLMAAMGISGDVIDECLNHVIESRVRRTYIRDRRPVEQARAFDALGERLAALAK